MTSEVDGYTLEIGYTHEYSSILSPTHLRLVALHRRVAFPTRNPLRYLELGCGYGVSLNVHAAASPGEYWGVDANPSHIAFANKLAAVSGANVRFLSMSFAELLNHEELPDFDVIVAHGVWTWISDESRKCIIELLRKKLVDGGFFYLSYNSLPGSAGIVPLQKMLRLHSEKARPRDQILKRLSAAIQFTEELRNAGSEFFLQTPIASECLTSMHTHDPNYLCHEYLHANWSPFSFGEIAELMSEIDLHFVGNADFVQYHRDLTFDTNSARLLKSVQDPVLRESARDMLRNRVFRRDIFVKGDATLNKVEQAAAFCENEFVLLTPLNEIPEAVNFGESSYSLSATPYGKILRALGEDEYRSKTVAELTHKPSLSDIDPTEIIRALLFLTTIELVHPVQTHDSAATAAEFCKKLNLEVFQGSTSIRALASPILGNGVRLPHHWRFFIDSKFFGATEPSTWASYAWNQLQNKRATNSGERERILKGAQIFKEAMTFQRNLPVYESLGIDFNAFHYHQR